MNRDQIRQTALQCGFDGAEYIPVGDIRFHEEVRALCAGNACRGYGASWACPPAVGTVEECRSRMLQYDWMLLLSKVYSLEDSFDLEGMQRGMRHFKRVVDGLEEHLAGRLQGYQLLSNEGCGRCKACTYPHAPCRFPERLHHSLEGYGLMVGELAAQAGLSYHHGENMVTFFGALLMQDDEKERMI